MQFWLYLLLVLGLGLAAWINSMDVHGSSTTAAWLWAATALGGAHLVFRLLMTRAR